MKYVLFIVAILMLLGFSFLMSNDKKKVNFKSIGILFLLQLVIGFFMLNTSIGGAIIEAIANGFNTLLSFGNEGIAFVFGGFEYNESGTVFFISVLLMMVFTSSLLSILTYLKILPLLIKYLGGAIARVTGLPMVESFCAVASSVFGNTGGLLAVKNQIPKMSKNRLFIAVTTSLTSVSASILGSYMLMLPARYILVSIPLNVLSGLMLSSIVAPAPVEKDEKIDISEMVTDKSLFESIGNGAIDGMKVAGIVAAMLIAYTSLIAMSNAFMNGVFHITLTDLMGYILSPIAFLMGVPLKEAITAGGVMGTKIISNEFVAMLNFKDMLTVVSPRTVAIVTSFLMSFANFSSIGIILGTVQAISKEQSSVLAKFGLKILLVSTMASFLTATVVGIFV